MGAGGRPVAGSGREGEAATGAVDRATNDGEPESRTGHGARCRCPVEAVEDAGEVLPVDAGAVVPDGDRPVAQADLDPLTGRAPLAGVVQHVDDRTLELMTPALDARWLEVEHDGDVRCT